MLKIQPLPLIPGSKVTIYSISDGAMTTKVEATVTEIYLMPEFRKSYVSQGPTILGNWRFGTMKPKGKRKEFYIEYKPHNTIVLKGWGHPDRDCDAFNKFSINACLNIAASPEVIKEMVNRNLNTEFSAHDQILSVEDPDAPVMVYPDHPTSHAVIERMRETQSKEVSQ